MADFSIDRDEIVALVFLLLIVVVFVASIIVLRWVQRDEARKAAQGVKGINVWRWLLKTVAIVVGGTIVLTVPAAVVKSLKPTSSKTTRIYDIDKHLSTTAVEINKTVPQMLDSITRMDTVLVNERTVQYLHTMLIPKHELIEDEADSVEFAEEFYAELLNGIQNALKAASRRDLLAYRDNNVVFEYIYRDEDGEEITKLRFEKNDYAPPNKNSGESAEIGNSTDDDSIGMNKLANLESFRSVKIGNLIWMAENLNFATSGSRCYSDSPDSCEKYGRLYTWHAAMNACPNGWHLPTREEWGELVKAADDDAGKKLKAALGWKDYDGKSGNGTDEFGFSALPSGYRYYDGSSYNLVGHIGSWWSATESGGNAYRRIMYFNYNNVHENSNNKNYGFSVRCVRD